MKSLRHSVVAAVVGGMVLCGCAAERHKDIPATAPLVTKGMEDITYTPTEDGMVYIYDKSVGHLLYSGQVRANQVVLVRPGDDKITIGGQTVSEAKMRKGNEHRIFFEPMAIGSSSTLGGNSSSSVHAHGTGTGTSSMSGSTSGSTMQDMGTTGTTGTGGEVYRRTVETTVEQQRK